MTTATVQYRDRGREFRLELAFNEKPDGYLRGQLKRLGFWWDSRHSVWYLRQESQVTFVRHEPVMQDLFASALTFFQSDPTLRAAIPLTADQMTQLHQARRDSKHVLGTRGMEDALGIA